MTGAASMTVPSGIKAAAVVEKKYYGCFPVNHVQGADVSQWQAKTTEPRKDIDFNKMKAQGVEFVFLRVTIRGNTDANFQRGWAAAKACGLIRGAYIALDYRTNVAVQMDKTIKLLVDDAGELPVALDFEKLLYSGLGPDKALERLREGVELADVMFGRKCIIYTNPDAINNLVKVLPAWFISHDLWVAHYGVPMLGPDVGFQYFTKPGLPKGGFRFWQYTDRGDGIAHGCQSKQIDLNWWNGTRAELLAYCKLAPDGGVVVAPKTLEERVAALEGRVSMLDGK